MKQIWYFLIIICTQLKCWMMSHSRRWREARALEDAVMFGAEMDRLWRLADMGEIGVDFEHALYNMSSKEYEDHICMGPFTPPSEMKAHLYFANIRTWMNIHREKLNAQGHNLPPLDKEDPIVWGVADDKGEIYIIGKETRTTFDVRPNPQPHNLNPPTS